MTSNGTIMLLHYYNDFNSKSILLSNTNRLIGFSKINIKKVNGGLICTFRRAKMLINVQNYFDTTKSYYILAAIGKLDDSGNFI